mmetsp:Transcript_26773/g.37691  ORF Transcript_26773/g.37691 Transcript_26773/m.37691 type:complete len:90 (-) Transcript_26773:1259-1528(-)
MVLPNLVVKESFLEMEAYYDYSIALDIIVDFIPFYIFGCYLVSFESVLPVELHNNCNTLCAVWNNEFALVMFGASSSLDSRTFDHMEFA